LSCAHLVALAERELGHILHKDGREFSGDLEVVCSGQRVVAQVVEREARDVPARLGNAELAAPEGKLAADLDLGVGVGGREAVEELVHLRLGLLVQRRVVDLCDCTRDLAVVCV